MARLSPRILPTSEPTRTVGGGAERCRRRQHRRGPVQAEAVGAARERRAAGRRARRSLREGHHPRRLPLASDPGRADTLDPRTGGGRHCLRAGSIGCGSCSATATSASSSRPASPVRSRRAPSWPRIFNAVVFLPESQNTVRGFAVATALTLLPFALLEPFAGVFVDRWPRRPILVVLPLVRAAAALLALPGHRRRRGLRRERSSCSRATGSSRRRRPRSSPAWSARPRSERTDREHAHGHAAVHRQHDRVRSSGRWRCSAASPPAVSSRPRPAPGR